MPNSFFRFQKDAAAIFGLFVLIAALFYDLPTGYWRADDPALLLHALQSDVLRTFYDPLVWQKISSSNLTPWLTLSLEFDWWIAGFEPAFFYLHTLVSLALVAAAAYALARLWMAPSWSFLFGFLFLVGAPTASVVQFLMTRHYLEGLLFALLSAIAFVLAIRRQSLGWAVGGALAYALAATAKEIYVPLVLVLPLIPPIGRVAARLRLAAPYFAVAAAYVLWRQSMLGNMVGGYVDGHSLFSMQSIAKIIAAIGQFPAYFFGRYWVFPTLLVAGLWVAAAGIKPRALPVFGALVVCTLGPLLPLALFPGIFGPDRYLFLVWFVASFASVLAIQTLASAAFSFNTRLNTKRLAFPAGMATVAVLLVFSFASTGEVQKQQNAMLREFDTQGRFYFQAGDNQAFIPTPALLASYWYVTSFCEIKALLGKTCPLALIKGVPNEKPIGRLYAYDPKQGTMPELTGSAFEGGVQALSALDKTKPLSAKLSVEQGWGRWQLGPYTNDNGNGNGQYYFASPSLGRFPVSQQGVIRTPLVSLSLYIQYESAEGWATSSPLLEVGAGQPIRWMR